MIRNWFRTKRSLVGQLDDFEAIVAKQIDEIQELRGTAREGYDRAVAHADKMAGQRDHARQLLAAHEQKNVRLVEELKTLHAEIRRAELADAIAEETQMKRRLDV